MRRLLLVCASLLFSVVTFWAQGENQQKFKVTGSVSNAATGQPVGGALVEFQGSNPRRTMTGSDGQFEFDGITGGTGFVSARRPGFAPSAAPQRMLSGSSTDPIVIKLVPLGKILGRVTDREGEPIEGVSIQCLHQTIVNGRKQWQPANGATTDETGHFLIEDVPPGAYIVRTREMQLYHIPQQKSMAARYIYPPTFYPDAQTRDMAQPIELVGGQEMKVDLTLQSIRGARVSLETVPRYPNVMATLSAGDDYFENRGAQTDASGVLTFGAVPPGSWKIVVRGPFSGARAPGQEVMYGELQLDVGSTDIENLKLPLSSLPEIPVQVSGGANTQLSVQLFSKAGQAHGSTVDQSGEMKITGVIPGTYRVVVQSNGNECVTSVMSGSQDLLRDQLVVSPGGSVPAIQVVQSTNCASLQVSANTKTQAVVLITSSLSGFEPRILGGTSLELTLTPGEYKVYAFDDVTDLEYANPDAMRDFKSQTVELEAGQKASVQLEVNQRLSP